MSAQGRPALGKPAVGDLVYVIRSANDMRGRKPEDRAIPAKVVKVARVWVTVETETGYSRERRFRISDQSDGSNYPGSSERFVTSEQLAWEITRRGANEYLRDQGVDIGYRSPWRGREVELAALLKTAETSPGEK